MKKAADVIRYLAIVVCALVAVFVSCAVVWFLVEIGRLIWPLVKSVCAWVEAVWSMCPWVVLVVFVWLAYSLVEFLREQIEYTREAARQERQRKEAGANYAAREAEREQQRKEAEANYAAQKAERVWQQSEAERRRQEQADTQKAEQEQQRQRREAEDAYLAPYFERIRDIPHERWDWHYEERTDGRQETRRWEAETEGGVRVVLTRRRSESVAQHRLGGPAGASTVYSVEVEGVVLARYKEEMRDL